LSLYWIGDAGAFRLAICARPRGEDWLQDELGRLQNSGVQILVSMLTHDEMEELGLLREQEECQRHGIEYLNFPIEDRGVPTDRRKFTRLVDHLVIQLKAGKAVAVHCRAGIGRSSLLACSVLVRSGSTCPQAWLSIQKARGCPVPDTNEQRAFVEGLSQPARREWIEIHDSTLESLTSDGDRSILVFSAAYIHKFNGGHMGWVQRAILRIRGGIVSGAFTQFPCDLMDGYLTLSEEKSDNLIPIPLNFSGRTELLLTSEFAESVHMSGDYITLELMGEPRYVEDNSRLDRD
jgi:protein-tyrosine phosphatase